LLAQAGFFVATWSTYHNPNKVREWAKALNPFQNPFPFAKGGASNITFNCVLILLSMCRYTFTRLRFSYRPLTWLLPLDDHIIIHRWSAWAMSFWAVVHTISHYINYHRTTLPSSTTLATQVSPTDYVYKSTNGLTGHLLALILFLMATSAFHVVRRSKHENFWYTHQLFYLFFGILLATHGFHDCTSKLVNPLTDLVADIQLCYSTDFWSRTSFWKFMALPVLLFTGERIYRQYQLYLPSWISKVVFYPHSQVVNLVLKKPLTFPSMGQYVFINVPDISKYQWHPFTLTSGPGSSHLTVHVRMSGDWTTELAKVTGCITDAPGKTISDGKAKVEVSISNVNKPQGPPAQGGGKFDEQKVIRYFPKVKILGPFGTACGDVFEFPVSVLVGAGIGLTPYSSVLKHIL
jgi:NADPH oxidase